MKKKIRGRPRNPRAPKPAPAPTAAQVETALKLIQSGTAKSASSQLHNASVAVLLKHLGVDPPPLFVFGPSTITTTSANY